MVKNDFQVWWKKKRKSKKVKKMGKKIFKKLGSTQIYSSPF